MIGTVTAGYGGEMTINKNNSDDDNNSSNIDKKHDNIERNENYDKDMENNLCNESLTHVKRLYYHQHVKSVYNHLV